MFYEMYLQDYNGDLIDVPVLVRNLYDNNGRLLNEESQTDENLYKLVRRFFIFDTKSGVDGENGYINGKISTVVRYPKSITLRVKLDQFNKGNEEMIYTPLLIISYRERSQTIIQDLPLARATFTSEYAMDTTAFWNVIKIVFIVMNGIFLLLLIMRIIVWCRTPSLSNDAAATCKYAVVKIFVTGIDLYSYLFFWFLVIISGYWFVFFKLEERVYLLLPALNSS